MHPALFQLSIIILLLMDIKTFSALTTPKIEKKKYFLDVHKFTSKFDIRGDMGWIPSKQRRFLDIIRYWYRLLGMNDNILCKHVFLWNYTGSYSVT